MADTAKFERLVEREKRRLRRWEWVAVHMHVHVCCVRCLLRGRVTFGPPNPDPAEKASSERNT